ncbi:MAG TPA: DegT/DnrJ/EryC1/StrS family aminotransferase [Solirubrobacteraceae bacterium]|nr:DegT/DnrJ/EryC1/StrS family aminotransferase [Solirubrobacteraceae bacterium]
MSLPLVDLAAAYAEQQAELEAAVLRVCRSQRFIGGPEVSAFEDEFARYAGSAHCVGVANGTVAIELVLRALEVGPGDEVLVPANTFIATAEAVSAVGATPRFVDVDPASGLIDLESASERLNGATRVIIPVHLYGRMADMGAVGRFAGEHGLFVVEDAAQAQGASRAGRRAGTVGIAGCFSFYPGKNIGAFGDAGAIVTDDAELEDRLRLLRDHGRRGRDHHELRGVNGRLDALQAAVLRVKLPRLDDWNRARRASALRYRELLPDAVLDWSSPEPDAEVHHVFPVLVPGRDAVAAHLAGAGIHTGVHYRHALTQTPAFGNSGDSCPAAERRAALQLSLPMHPHLQRSDEEKIAGAVCDSISQAVEA